MRNNVNIYFKCQDLMYSLMLKTSVEEITLSTLEGRIYKKLALDESKVKLKLSYNPFVVGYEGQFTISDDEDVGVYLTSVDKENRRCILFVEVITISVVPEQVSRVGKSSVGKNYDDLDSIDCGVGANAIIAYVEKEQAKQQDEAIVDADDNTKEDGSVSRDGTSPQNTTHDESVAYVLDRWDKGDDYVELPPVLESSKFIEAWEDGLGVSLLQEFPNRKALQNVVDRGSFVKSFTFDIIRSEPGRLVLKCTEKSCTWCLRATRVKHTEIFSIRTYNKMHTCSRANQSKSNKKRHGTPELVAAILQADYPGKMKTPTPQVIMDLLKTKLGVNISYSTALRGRNLVVSDLRGTPEESYKMLYCYLHMLEKHNNGTITRVKLDEKEKFKYLFIALGASIEGFKVMRKVIIVDATFLKNTFGGVLIFATAQDPNRHNYPIAFGVLDGENDASWTWFMEMLKIVIPDSSELVFMTDRNGRLISAIADVYPQAHHGYCVWHLSQNVKGHASNVNKDVVAWRFMECSRHYTVADFNCAYTSFKTRYPSAAKYVEESTVKEKWARCFFPGERYNLDTSNAVESLNSAFLDARKYSLIPMLDAIIKKISNWFNERRKEAVSGSISNKLVPLVENCMHDLWPQAEKLHVTELNTFELEYNVIGNDGKAYMVNLLLKSCSCKVFDIEKYPCVHALAAYIVFLKHDDGDRDIKIHELCSKYYWMELWAMAYYKTIYLVPDMSQWDMSQWDVPDDIKKKLIIPPDKKVKKGRNKVKRFPSAGERRPRTQNKRRPRQGLQWLLFGNRFSV